MATCVDVAGGKYPEVFNGNKMSPMEGISLLNTLNGEIDIERTLAFENQGVPAIRKGDWKLVSRKRYSMTAKDFSDDVRFELYNFSDDRSETNNLAENNPEKVADLKN